MIGFGFACDWLRSGGTSFINQSKSKVKSTNKSLITFKTKLKPALSTKKKRSFYHSSHQGT